MVKPATIQEKRQAEYSLDKKGKIKIVFSTKNQYIREGMATITSTKMENADEKEYIQVWDRATATATRHLMGQDKEEILKNALNKVLYREEMCMQTETNDQKLHSFISTPKFNPCKTGDNLHFVSNLSNFQNFSYSKENFDPKFKSAANLDLATYNPVTSNYVREGAQNAQHNDLKWVGWRENNQ